MTRLAYCQYLLVSQINHTLTTFADHGDAFSHEAVNRYRRGERLTPRLVWDNVRGQSVPTPEGYLLFDDTVLDKSYSHRIELVRWHWSGAAKAVIKGIGVVTCVYVNPETAPFWRIDYRLYDPDGDGKSTLDHVHTMLTNAVHHKQLPFHAARMDTWYATKAVMLLSESVGKMYYGPLQDNRQVDDAGGERPSQRVDSRAWSPPELTHGKTIKIKGFPKAHQVRLVRVEVSTHRTDWVVTNAPPQDSTEATQQACGVRWKIEPLPREGKQVTGLERCPCRQARIQRNYIGCAVLVWARLKHLADQTKRTVYQLKHGLLNDYLIQQLQNPALEMVLA